LIFLLDLPNVQERLEILMYHLGRLRTNELLDSSISAYNLQQLAAGTNNYSGADIAGLVKSAKNAATLRSFQVSSFEFFIF
jgi:SpoVK/Ycf46/Vps4 family AAA+-type ATPase